MFGIVLRYIELRESIIAIIISIIGLWISIHVWMKDKPILYVEEHSSKENDKSISFYFYLDNIGKQPTSIKEIQFYTRNKFSPKITLIEISKEVIVNIEGKGIQKTDFVGINLPFHLMPHSSKLIKADLDFGTPENFQKEYNEGQILYLNIKHTSKKDFTKKFLKEKKLYSLIRTIKNWMCTL